MGQRMGVQMELRAIADLDVTTDRGVSVDPAILTTDAAAVVARPDVDIIVELIGGTGIARELTMQALKLGKAVVTANKALLAKHGEELYRTAEENSADLYFEAAGGGGIPVIRALREGLIANHIDSMYGILNGTCNYILTRMELEGLPFEQVLSEAQKLGYAEAEPSLDVDGHDTAHKAVILASLAYGFPVSLEDCATEGIRQIDPMDLTCAASLGYRIKLLAVIRSTEDGVSLSVNPALVPAKHPLGSVSGVFNAVLVHGDIVGDTLYYGRGAGRLPTASAVLGDIADVVRNLATDSSGRVPPLPRYERYEKMADPGETRCRNYVRFTLKDKPGVLAKVATVLGEHGISIASVMQREVLDDGFAPVIILTAMAREADMVRALSTIENMDLSGAPAVRLRVQSFDG